MRTTQESFPTDSRFSILDRELERKRILLIWSNDSRGMSEEHLLGCSDDREGHLI